MRDMFSGEGELFPLDNERYPGLRFTTIQHLLSSKAAAQAAESRVRAIA